MSTSSNRGIHLVPYPIDTDPASFFFLKEARSTKIDSTGQSRAVVNSTCRRIHGAGTPSVTDTGIIIAEIIRSVDLCATILDLALREQRGKVQ